MESRQDLDVVLLEACKQGEYQSWLSSEKCRQINHEIVGVVQHYSYHYKIGRSHYKQAIALSSLTFYRKFILSVHL
ncbi:hypothetical protein [Pseudanabaena yagii]|uniref:Uncharacterized protein n=1 Tax=Pseudanabaena yagii GIHE-NHR1 TaxID=2722753 RepID=A0ABX1M2Y5_9CYAN|nr:hypothetical protein [Pseudanabaena yagii]NMF60462.1 hypothetical protein [Pseudanabaena yagii GIHE-NHR1]